MKSEALRRMKLQALSYIWPGLAGQIATRWFSTSRNPANVYRKALTPMGAHKKALVSDAHRVSDYYIWGTEGDIVLLIHGWGANCSSMFGFVKPLMDQGYRVVTFDAPAHGSTVGNYTTMAEFVAAATEVIQALGSVRHIIAHSLGGIVAMAAAARMTSIERIVLISSPCSLMDVLDIWSSQNMKLRPNIRERVLKQLLEDNGVPVAYWDIGVHGRKWNGAVQIIHDRSDKIVGVHHPNKILSILPNAEIFLTDGLGHIKILMDSKVYQRALDFLIPSFDPVEHRSEVAMIVK